MSRIAVTGVNGFVGRHMVRELAAHDIEVVGVGYSQDPPTDTLSLLDSYVAADLTQAWPKTGNLDAIIHLAGLSAVGPSFADRERYLQVNPAMFQTIAEHYVDQSDSPRIIAVSSGAVYDPDQQMPETEEAKLVDIESTNVSPYAVSKLLMEKLCSEYRDAGLDCVIARPFNHTGPGQTGDFFVPQMTNDLLVAAREGKPVLSGRLDTKRDFTDVRDIVRAYRMLATADPSDLSKSVYNVCSGESTSMHAITEQLQILTDTTSVEVTEDSSRFRPNDPKEVVGSYETLNRAVGWKPEIALKTTLADFVRSL